ncbi:MAG: galactose oxidase, partial [Planctomycetes bacterium]|nr:galactose oxidase [Planctomycetota bacterium]
ITTTNAPAGRSNHPVIWTGDRMIVWSGLGTGNSGGIYDPATDTWTATDTVNAPSARYYHTAVWTGDRMIIWGGSYLNTGSIYDPFANTWTAISTTKAPSGRNRHAAVWTGSRMIIWGGWNGAAYLNTGGLYTLPEP